MNTETYEPTTEPAPIAEPTIHLARCAECGHAVRFQPNGSGTGFILIDADLLHGAGDHNRPLCPDGHGEMEIADDRLPIEQAMTQVAEQLDATTQRLPFPSPPFNYEGALHEIFEKQKAVAILEAKFNDADERRKKAKAALDTGHSELSMLIGTLQEREQDRLHEIARRQAAAAAGHPEDTTLVRCAWEQKNPGKDCPACADPKLAAKDITAQDAGLHIDAVELFVHERQTRVIVDVLGEEAGLVISKATVSAWSEEDRAAVLAWAGGSPDGMPRPAILGTAHVAADFTTSEAVPGDTYQCCRECGARLLSNKTGSDDGESFVPYPAGALVGTDCQGAKEPARYAKRGRKKS